jgi:hypothetical protein
MTRNGTDHRDVHIHADRETLAHKLEKNLPDDEVAYWTVNGKPRQTGAGAKIYFSTADHVVARGEIIDVEEGRIWFDDLTEPDQETVPGIQPPRRGFKYGPVESSARGEL